MTCFCHEGMVFVFFLHLGKNADACNFDIMWRNGTREYGTLDRSGSGALLASFHPPR